MGLMQGNKGIIGKGDNALDPDKHFDVIVLMLEPPDRRSLKNLHSL
jgi:hypothetical protein